VTDPRATDIDRQSSPLEFSILLEQGQIAAASRHLEQQGLIDPRPKERATSRLARRVRRQPDPALVLKTWDVKRCLDAFASRIEPSDAVLDVGSYACDMLPALKRLGYRNLFGIDLDPAVLQMPYADSIDYTVGDLMATPWPDGQFAGISAVSVIEHGVQDEDLCREVSRLLRPGGIFVFTTDYWPEKIATTERMFGLDWRIFDAAEIAALVDVARSHNLHPASDPRDVVRDVRTPAIHFSGKDYTFLYGAFVRGED
jgi:SAM-dependent methyltransferase